MSIPYNSQKRRPYQTWRKEYRDENVLSENYFAVKTFVRYKRVAPMQGGDIPSLSDAGNKIAFLVIFVQFSNEKFSLTLAAANHAFVSIERSSLLSWR